jgi:hypothetical protein
MKNFLAKLTLLIHSIRLRLALWFVFILALILIIFSGLVYISLARALRVGAQVEPVFVEAVGELPRVIAEQSRDGDVVLCMGAGSIGAVCAQVVELLQKQEQKVTG